MGEKHLLWFSVRRIDGAWKCIVWRGRAAIFIAYGCNRDALWAQAWAHLLAVQEVAA